MSMGFPLAFCQTQKYGVMGDKSSLTDEERQFMLHVACEKKTGFKQLLPVFVRSDGLDTWRAKKIAEKFFAGKKEEKLLEQLSQGFGKQLCRLAKTRERVMDMLLKIVTIAPTKVNNKHFTPKASLQQLIFLDEGGRYYTADNGISERSAKKAGKRWLDERNEKLLQLVEEKLKPTKVEYAHREVVNNIKKRVSNYLEENGLVDSKGIIEDALWREEDFRNLKADNSLDARKANQYLAICRNEIRTLWMNKLGGYFHSLREYFQRRPGAKVPESQASLDDIKVIFDHRASAFKIASDKALKYVKIT